MKQAMAFTVGEGERWLERNKDKLTGENDPVMDAIDQYQIKPKKVLEVGCANGWRLKLIKKKFKNSVCGGIDPGCGEPTTSGPAFVEFGTAERLDFPSESFDLLIYGWCLYLVDPEDYFRIAMEGDRVLKDNGYLIIYDFLVQDHYKTPYKHKKGLFSYHYDFARLWSNHPAYVLYGRIRQDKTCITILKKNLEKAFEER